MRIFGMLTLAFAAFITGANTLKADIIIAVTDGSLDSYVPGSINRVNIANGSGTGVLSVWAYDTTSSSVQFEGFHLAFDVSPIGDHSPSFLFTDFDGLNPVISSDFSIETNRPNALNYDLVVNAFGGEGVVMPGIDNPLKLFDLTFSVDGSAPLGLYEFKFVPGAEDFGGVFGKVSVNEINATADGGDFSTMSAAGGEFQVVPEPSSVALLSLLGVGGMTYRRFRGKKTA